MANERYVNGLRENELFAGLSDPDIEAIAQRCQWHRYEDGQEIIGQSDSTTDVFFIVEGVVRAKSYSASGREVSFVDIGAGALFGEFSAIDGRPRSSAVVSLSKCQLGRMSASDFRQVLNDHHAVALRLINLLVRKTRTLSDRIFEFSTQPVQGRVRIELLRMAEDVGADGNRAAIRPAPTHQELATRISTHREAVTRELNHLAGEGIIEMGRRRIDVLDVARLRDLVSDDLNN